MKTKHKHILSFFKFIRGNNANPAENTGSNLELKTLHY